MTKTIINVRADSAVKKAAQKAAKELGVSLSVVVNYSLREFIRNPHIELKPLVPNAHTAQLLRVARKEPKSRVFNSMEDLLAELT